MRTDQGRKLVSKNRRAAARSPGGTLGAASQAACQSPGPAVLAVREGQDRRNTGTASSSASSLQPGRSSKPAGLRTSRSPAGYASNSPENASAAPGQRESHTRTPKAARISAMRTMRTMAERRGMERAYRLWLAAPLAGSLPPLAGDGTAVAALPSPGCRCRPPREKEPRDMPTILLSKGAEILLMQFHEAKGDRTGA